MRSDALNPMMVAHYTDRPTGAEAWLVVDTFLHGVAGGGVRMSPEVTERVMTHLAATMSMKLAVVEPPCGGAKCGIRYDPKAPDSKEVFARVVRAFAPFLQNCWVTGSDLGTSWQEVVAASRQYAGIPHPQYALLKAYSSADPAEIQRGIERMTRGTSLTLDEAAHMQMSDSVTGWTVAAATGEALRVKGEDVRGKRVAIQGFGAVGGSAAKFLSEAGATIVAVSDELGAVVTKDMGGLDIDGLLKIRKAPGYKVIDREQLARQYTYELAERDDVLYLDVDVLVPAAGSHLSLDLQRVKAKLIVEGANDPFTDEQEELLYRRGVTIVPDAIANCGSAGLYGLLVVGAVPLESRALLEFLRDEVQKITRRVLEEDSEPPRKVFERIARAEIRNRIAEGHSVMPNGLSVGDLRSMEAQDMRIRYRETSPYSLAEAV